eukprot:Clim_evm6s52 gene=Clim_evmTU6s52
MVRRKAVPDKNRKADVRPVKRLRTEGPFVSISQFSATDAELFGIIWSVPAFIGEVGIGTLRCARTGRELLFDEDPISTQKVLYGLSQLDPSLLRVTISERTRNPETVTVSVTLHRLVVEGKKTLACRWLLHDRVYRILVSILGQMYRGWLKDSYGSERLNRTVAKSSVKDLLEIARPTGLERPAAPRIIGLNAMLRPYQAHVVAWMVSREQEVAWKPVQKADDTVLSVLDVYGGRSCVDFVLPVEGSWEQGENRKEKLISFNVVTGTFAATQQSQLPGNVPNINGHAYANGSATMKDEEEGQYHHHYHQDAHGTSNGDHGTDHDESGTETIFGNVRGGILADEMGLGKTVETIATILTHQRDRPTLQSLGLKEVIDTDDSDSKSLRNRKIIECIACSSIDEIEDIITSRKLQSRLSPKRYICATCIRNRRFPTAATLIVCPQSILLQWQEEIEKHCDMSAFKCIIYEGIQKQGYVSPLELMEADVVLVSYSTFRSEVHYIPENRVERSSRHKRRRIIPSSPLTCIEWWRMCVDEVQMVEGRTSKAAEVARMLNVVNRWCISGTPLSHALPDLEGLSSLLRIPLFDRDPELWTLLKNGVTPFLNTLQLQMVVELMWRNEKHLVASEMYIPPQSESMISLELSPIEAHFYSREQEAIRPKMEKVLHAWHRGIRAGYYTTTDNEQLRRCLENLWPLRRACVHPQISIKGGTTHNLSKATSTLQNVLDAMIANTTVEAEEVQRKLAMAMNGMAACYYMKGETVKAIETYDAVIALDSKGNEIGAKKDPTTDGNRVLKIDVHTSESHGQQQEQQEQPKEQLRKDVRLDPMQKLHSIHNLGEIIKESKTVVDDSASVISHDLTSLRQTEKTLIEAYLRDFERAMEQALGALDQSAQRLRLWDKYRAGASSVPPKRESHDGPPEWAAMLAYVSSHSLEKKVLSRIQAMYQDVSGAYANLDAMGMRSLAGVHYLFATKYGQISEKRDEVMSMLRTVVANFSDEIWVERQANCGKCRQDLLRTGPECDFCRINRHLLIFDGLLFGLSAAERMESEMDVVGRQQKDNAFMRDDGLCELIAKATLQVIRHHHSSKAPVGDDVSRDGDDLLARFTQVKKERWSTLGTLWTKAHDLISARDEVKMFCHRIRIRRPEQIVAPHEETLWIEPFRIDEELRRHQADCTVEQDALRRKQGHLIYLKHLSTPASSKATVKPEQTQRPQHQESEQGQEHQQQATAVHHEDCPVCLQPLMHQFALFPCAHGMHNECTFHYFERFGHRASMPCPKCRAQFAIDAIVHVDNTASAAGGGAGSNGTHRPRRSEISTKIDALVDLVADIAEERHGSVGQAPFKCLIFSQWTRALEVIHHALEGAGVRCLSALGSNVKAQRAIASFKRDPAVTCLLLRLKDGGRGLNLTEATHVFLVEPSLNKAEEDQAVNRVHRMGQRMETFVYRFGIKGSIEEHILALTSQTYRTQSTRQSLGGGPTSGSGKAVGEMDARLTYQDVHQLYYRSLGHLDELVENGHDDDPPDPQSNDS